MTQISQHLSYHPGKNHYCEKEDCRVVDTKIVNQERYRWYENGNYHKLFEEFDPDRHDIRKEQVSDDELYVLIENRNHSRSNDTEEVLPAGCYHVKNSFTCGVTFVPFSPASTDRHISLNNRPSRLNRDMTSFSQNSSFYRDRDIAYRRGALLYGPPGNGKTHSIMQAANDMIEQLNGVVFFLSSSESVSFSDLASHRKHLKDRRKLFVLEEMTQFTSRNQIDELLNFFDGEYSWETTYNVATTNYPGDLPGNIVDRPGRFDLLLPYERPDRSQRMKILNAYLQNTEVTEELADQLEGFSISYVKEFALRLERNGGSVEEVLEEFQTHRERIRHAFKNPERNIGFMEVPE